MKIDMELGSFISGQITQIAQSSTSPLGFPALITTLCDAQGVVFDTLTFESLSLVINLAYIKKNCWNLADPSIAFPGPHCADARVAAPDALPPTQPPPPPAARRQSPSTSAPMDPHSQTL